MIRFIDAQLLRGVPIVLPMAALVGGALGALGGALGRVRRVS